MLQIRSGPLSGESSVGAGIEDVFEGPLIKAEPRGGKSCALPAIMSLEGSSWRLGFVLAVIRWG